MSKQSFDPITRSIRAAEAQARQTVAAVDTVIESSRRKRNLTLATFQPLFKSIDECLNSANQLHDAVTVNAHFVADNISERSHRNINNVRSGLLEAASRMVELCSVEQLPQGVYDPTYAFSEIDSLLAKNGWIDKPTVTRKFYSDRSQVVYIAGYTLVGGYSFSVVVSVQANNHNVKLEDGDNKITVSVWEDQSAPPVWDMSYHESTCEEIAIKGTKQLGRWTKQTTNAIIDYVASVLSKVQVKVPTARDMQTVPRSIGDKPSIYGTFKPRPERQGTEKFKGATRNDILRQAIHSVALGEKGEFEINLHNVIDKSTLARYVLSIIQDQVGRPDLNGSIRLHRDGYYQIQLPSAVIQGFNVAEKLSSILIDANPNEPITVAEETA